MAEFEPDLQTPNVEKKVPIGQHLFDGVVLGIKEVWTHSDGHKSYEHVTCHSRSTANCPNCIYKDDCPVALKP